MDRTTSYKTKRTKKKKVEVHIQRKNTAVLKLLWMQRKAPMSNGRLNKELGS